MSDQTKKSSSSSTAAAGKVSSSGDSSGTSKDEASATPSGPSTASSSNKGKDTATTTAAAANTDFWDVLVKLDTMNVCKKGKSLARSHSSAGCSSMEEEQHCLPLEYSPLGQLIEQLAHPVIKRSSLLTDKLLKLLSLVSSGIASNSTSSKHTYTQENLDAMERLFGLAVQVRLISAFHYDL